MASVEGCEDGISKTEEYNMTADNPEDNVPVAFDNRQENDDLNTNNNSDYIAATDTEYTIDLQTSTKSGRKRKFDEEGFVTPATPDIPRSSSKYEMVSDHVNSDYQEYYDYEKDNNTNHHETSDNYNTEDPLLTNSRQYDSSINVLTDKAEEMKLATLEWCREFGDSENFELFCVSSLDQLILNAQNLEETLRKQKDILRERLGFISRTLQEV